MKKRFIFAGFFIVGFSLALGYFYFAPRKMTLSKLPRNLKSQTAPLRSRRIVSDLNEGKPQLPGQAFEKTPQEPEGNGEVSKGRPTPIQFRGEESEVGYRYQITGIKIYRQEDLPKTEWIPGEPMLDSIEPIVTGTIGLSGVFKTLLLRGEYRLTSPLYETLDFKVGVKPLKVNLTLSKFGLDRIRSEDRRRIKIRVYIKFRRADGTAVPPFLGKCDVYEIPPDSHGDKLARDSVKYGFYVDREEHNFVIGRGRRCIVVYRSWAGRVFKLDMGVIERYTKKTLIVEVDDYRPVVFDLPRSMTDNYAPIPSMFWRYRTNKRAVYSPARKGIANVQDGDVILVTLRSKTSGRKAFVRIKLIETTVGFRGEWIGEERTVSGQVVDHRGDSLPNKQVFIEGVDVPFGSF
ncbi:MAG: hypothetical protein P1V97_28120, partial [Planctomycetota bacterium]|nr:hypothetical protein [Planctomycetota bacterium]